MLQLQRQSISTFNTTELPNYHVIKRTNVNHLNNCLKKRKKIRINNIKKFHENHSEECQHISNIINNIINPGKDCLTILKETNLQLFTSPSSRQPESSLYQRRRRPRRPKASPIELAHNTLYESKPTTIYSLQMQSSRLRIDIVPTLLKHQKRYTWSNNNNH